MPEQENDCICEGDVKLIFPCSGAADVGEISDRVARKLTAKGLGKMYCLAGIGGNISGIVATAKEADQILLIDGCNLDCAKKTMEARGIEKFTHFRVTDLGMEKSKSPATSENIQIVTRKGEELILERQKY